MKQNVPESMDELDEDVTLLKVSSVPIGIICQKIVNCITNARKMDV